MFKDWAPDHFLEKMIQYAPGFKIKLSRTPRSGAQDTWPRSLYPCADLVREQVLNIFFFLIKSLFKKLESL